MYRDDQGYWINVKLDSLTYDETAKVREYLDYPNNITSYTYIYFYLQENIGVLHINTTDEAYLAQDVFVGSKEFIYLFKLFSINKELALTACVETVKRKLEEEFGGLG